MTDLALRLKTDGYRALEHDRIARGGLHTWETRMLGRRAVVVRGQDGARLFYDESVVSRHRAVPVPLAGLLFGPGAVHGLDEPDHLDRKRMFLAALSPARTPVVATEVRDRLPGLLAEGRGHLHDVLVRAYGGAVLAWAGLDLDRVESDAWSRELARIVDGFGFAGAAYPRGWVARVRTDRWLRERVRAVRSGRETPNPDSALAAVARADLPIGTAAVELNNIVRLTVAVSWLGTFAAAALQQHPEWRSRLRDDLGAQLAFAQEVRRTAPFVPALAGRVRHDIEHDGVRLRTGDRIVLDVRAINHDPATWTDAHRFDPGRFIDHHPGPYEMVPQGGGAPEGHRCPGESLTVQLLVATLAVLATDVDPGHLGGMDLTRMPTRPAGT